MIRFILTLSSPLSLSSSSSSKKRIQEECKESGAEWSRGTILRRVRECCRVRSVDESECSDDDDAVSRERESKRR